MGVNECVNVILIMHEETFASLLSPPVGMGMCSSCEEPTPREMAVEWQVRAALKNRMAATNQMSKACQTLNGTTQPAEITLRQSLCRT